jgi:hypothetical protein
MAMHIGYQRSPILLRGILQQMFERPAFDSALALVGSSSGQNTPMRISGTTFKQLSEAKWLDKPVICRCDGDGVWMVEADLQF